MPMLMFKITWFWKDLLVKNQDLCWLVLRLLLRLLFVLFVKVIVYGFRVLLSQFPTLWPGKTFSAVGNPKPPRLRT